MTRGLDATLFILISSNAVWTSSAVYQRETCNSTAGPFDRNRAGRDVAGAIPQFVGRASHVQQVAAVRSVNHRHVIFHSRMSRCPAPRTTPKEDVMNKDQVAGAAKDATGKAQEKAGEAVGSPGQEAKGLVKQGEGKVQKAYGDAKEVLKGKK